MRGAGKGTPSHTLGPATGKKSQKEDLLGRGGWRQPAVHHQLEKKSPHALVMVRNRVGGTVTARLGLVLELESGLRLGIG